MSDGDLLVIGCAVSFIALAGAYVYIRERFEAGPRERRGVVRDPVLAAIASDEADS